MKIVHNRFCLMAFQPSTGFWESFPLICFLVAFGWVPQTQKGLQPIASFLWICWEVFKFAIRYAAFDQCCQLLDFVLVQPFHRLHRQQLCHGDEISLQLWSKSKWDHICWLNMVPLRPLPNTCIYSIYLYKYKNKYVCVYMLIFLLQKWAASMPKK